MLNKYINNLRFSFHMETNDFQNLKYILKEDKKRFDIIPKTQTYSPKSFSKPVSKNRRLTSEEESSSPHKSIEEFLSWQLSQVHWWGSQPLNQKRIQLSQSCSLNSSLIDGTVTNFKLHLKPFYIWKFFTCMYMGICLQWKSTSVSVPKN